MHRYWTRAGLVLILSFGLPFTGFAEDPPSAFERGKLIEKVVTLADANQSYAVYLPSKYDPKNKYPAIYAFDASGRGARAAGIYLQAAEKYGYVVFASNNSRNGLDSSVLSAALNAIWNDTHKRFSIDPERVLATGNSGGGRVATVFAYSCKGCVFGVIGAGAGFYAGVPVTKQLPFLFLATAGRDDFNYLEVRELEKKLTKAGVVNHLIVFDGGHQWPPPDVVDQAVAWFEIQQMSKRRRTHDEEFIDRELAQRMKAAEQLLVDKDTFGAVYALKSMASDFEGLRSTKDLLMKADALERSAEYKQAVKADENEIKQQQEIVAAVMSVLNDPANHTNSAELARVRAKISKVRERSAGSVDNSERRVARRVVNDIFVRTFETALYAHERAGKHEAALANLEIAAEASPRFAAIPYNQARISALRGDTRKALSFLQKAVDLGYKDRRSIENDKAFQKIRGEEQFEKVVATLPR